MSYSTGEALVLTQLQAVTGFSSSNTSRGKWGILNSGKDDNYGIIKPGSFSREESAMSANATEWKTVIQVWQRYKDDGVTLTNLEAHVDNIITRFDQYRKLADTTGTVIDSFIDTGGEAQEMWNKSGGLSWLKQEITVTWLEHSTIVYAE
jgi:hypothetical protein